MVDATAAEWYGWCGWGRRVSRTDCTERIGEQSEKAQKRRQKERRNLRLSSLFGISLDQLIKGDVEVMKSEIKKTDVETFRHYGVVLSVLFLMMIVTPVPLAIWFGGYGAAAWAVIAAAALGYSFKVENLKKAYQIQTYKEIVAFSEGKRLDEMETQQEIGKRPYQKALLVMISAAVTLAVCAVMGWLLS